MSIAEDLQRRGGLRRCQLPTCRKEESHLSQFKHCSGCKSGAVVYCCREHQVKDWPSHKAACRAAQKEQQQWEETMTAAGKKK